MTDSAPSETGGRGAALAASAAGVAATGALACAACCILPFALPAAALALYRWRACLAGECLSRGDRSCRPPRRCRVDLGRPSITAYPQASGCNNNSDDARSLSNAHPCLVLAGH
jgi:hypothetical protein